MPGPDQPPPGGNPPPGGQPSQEGYPQQPGYPQQQGPYGQSGYPPYGGGPGYGAPVVSSIPKIMGILMLVFGGIGLLSALVGVLSGGAGFGMPQQGIPADAMLKLREFQRLGNFVGLPLAFLQGFAGLWALRYKRHAQLLSNIYAAIAMVWVVVSIVLLYSWLLPAIEKMLPSGHGQEVKTIVGVVMVVSAFFGMIWPTLILILMNRKSARAACVN